MYSSLIFFSFFFYLSYHLFLDLYISLFDSLGPKHFFFEKDTPHIGKATLPFLVLHAFTISILGSSRGSSRGLVASSVSVQTVKTVLCEKSGAHNGVVDWFQRCSSPLSSSLFLPRFRAFVFLVRHKSLGPGHNGAIITSRRIPGKRGVVMNLVQPQ